MINTIIDFDNNKIKLNKLDHTYKIGDDIATYSVTEIMGKLKDFSYDTNYGMIGGVLKKVGMETNARLIYSTVKPAVEKYLKKKQEYGTAMHQEIEDKKIVSVEKILKEKIEALRMKEFKEHRELKFYDKVNKIAGTVDYFAIDVRSKKILLCDFKFSGRDMKPYLTLQLNIYKILLNEEFKDFEWHLMGVVLNITKEKEKTIKPIKIEVLNDYIINCLLGSLIYLKENKVVK